jgi:hypothetical protein
MSYHITVPGNRQMSHCRICNYRKKLITFERPLYLSADYTDQEMIFGIRA